MSVALVGAGPGDPDLLTPTAARLLASAEVVVHDALVGAGVLALILAGGGADRRRQAARSPDTPGADLHAVGRTPARASRVVRLKGGDPFVFGRGGEEAEALAGGRGAGRGRSRDLVIGRRTRGGGHPGDPSRCVALRTPWSRVTAGGVSKTSTGTHRKVDGTIVVLMACPPERQIAGELMAGGLPPTTPVGRDRVGDHGGPEVGRWTIENSPCRRGIARSES